jgi:hypothetical protein
VRFVVVKISDVFLELGFLGRETTCHGKVYPMTKGSICPRGVLHGVTTLKNTVQILLVCFVC